MANEDNNNKDNSELVWAVIDSGTRRIIGRVAAYNAFPGACAKVEDALELQCALTRLPGPGGLMEFYQPSMVPVDAEDDVVTIRCVIANIRLFSEMSDAGARYEDLRTRLLSALVAARAKQAGIELAGAPGRIIRGS